MKYKTLQTAQAIDYQTQYFFKHLLKIDSDEVLKTAGITRQSLGKLLSDDEIDQAIDRRKQALMNGRYQLTPSSGIAPKFVFEELDKFLGDIVTASLDSRLYGYDVAEMVWELGKTNRVKSITSKPLEWFNILNTGEVYYYPNNGQSPIEISSQDEFVYRYLVQVNEPTFKQPLGKSLLSRVYWLWYFKHNGWRFWSKFLERFGSPLLVGKADTVTEDEANDFASALLSAHNSGVITVGADDDIQAITANGNGEPFAIFHEAINKRITTYLLGQTLTSGVQKGGTYGQGLVHQEQQQIIFDSDKAHAKKAIQRFIDVICFANGYTPPKFEWVSDRGLQADRANRDKVLYEQGVRFTRAYYGDVYDLEEHHFYLVDDMPVLPNVAVSNTQSGAKTAINNPYTKNQQRLETLASIASNQLNFGEFAGLIANAKDKDELFDSLCKASLDGIDGVDGVMSLADLYGFIDDSK